MKEPCQGFPLLSTARAPAPATIAYYTSVPPTTAATVGSSWTASEVMPSGAFSSSWAIIVARIATWPISSEAMPNTRSRYLPGVCMFQPSEHVLHGHRDFAVLAAENLLELP